MPSPETLTMTGFSRQEPSTDPRSKALAMAPQANPLSGDLDRDLSPLTPFKLSGDIEKDLGAEAGKAGPGLRPAPPAPGASQELKSPLTPARDLRAEQVAQRLQSGGFGPSASWAVPGGIGMQMLGQGVVRGAESLLGGKGPLQAGKEALGAATGAGVLGGAMKGLGKAGSALGLPGYSAGISQNLADALKAKVPALEGMKTIKDMLYSQRAFNRVHRAFDDSLQAVVERGKGQTISMTAEDAKALGLKNMEEGTTIRPPISGRGKEPPTLVKVDAGEAATAITGTWKKDPARYRQVVNALDAANIGDPAARAAYKGYMGVRGFFQKVPGAIRPDGTLDLMKAQAGLVKEKAVDQLLKRDLGEFGDILTPGGKAVMKGSLAGPGAALGAGTLGLGGLLGGGHLGMGPLGGVLGAGHGAWLGTKLGSKIPTYSGVPAGPLQQILQQAAERAGGAAGQKVTE